VRRGVVCPGNRELAGIREVEGATSLSGVCAAQAGRQEPAGGSPGRISSPGPRSLTAGQWPAPRSSSSEHRRAGAKAAPTNGSTPATEQVRALYPGPLLG
jgi:hypothetical protein